MVRTLDVLIVDDNVDDYELCQRILTKNAHGLSSKYQFALQHAKTGNAALAVISRSLPDCVLLDYRLPGEDGLAILQQLRGLYPSLPIIFLTGQGNEQLVVALLKAGANDYIVKSELPEINLRQLIIATTQAALAEQSGQQPGAASGLAVWLIDSNITERDEVSNALVTTDEFSCTAMASASWSVLRERCARHSPDCILLGYQAGDNSVFELLSQLSDHYPFIPTIVYSSSGNERIAAQSIKRGAYDYQVTSEITPAKLSSIIKQALSEKKLAALVDEKNLEIKRYQHDLVERKKWFDRVVKATGIVVWEYDCAAKIFRLDEQVRVLLGVAEPLPELQLQQWHSYIHPDDRAAVTRRWRVNESGKEADEYDLVYRVLHTDKTYHWVRETGNIDVAPDGNVVKVVGLLEDISERKNAEARLRASEERYQLAFKGSSVGLWDWDIKTGQLFWSDRYKEMLGIKNSDFQPSYEEFTQRLHPDDRRRASHAMVEHLEKGTPYDIEYRLRHNDDSYAWVHVRGQAIRDSQGKATRIAGSIDDISSMKDAYEEILRSNLELERFAYMASHDLQEPLRMVISFTQLIKEKYADKLDEQGRNYINFATSGASRMRHLIQDLLAYARVGNEAETIIRVDLNSLITTIEESIMSSLVQADASIVWPKLPEVLADPVRISSVFQNLIGNAIKYRKPDTAPKVTIRVSAEKDTWVFCVCDNGLGIAEEYWLKIFEPFKRLHRNEEYSGTGMGLSICRKTIERMGGRIWVTSELGQGSQFHFTLPKIKSPLESSLS